MLQSLALYVPQIRRLYDHRNELLAYTTKLEAELCAAQDTATVFESRVLDLDNNYRELEEKYKQLFNELIQHQNPTIPESRHGELKTCHSLAERCVFVVGFARSNTTVTQQILNTAPNTLLLGEANFHIPKENQRFSDWYNAQHINFGNQATKSTFAPDLLPIQNHSWWQWLSAASAYYTLLGDKIAFTSFHFDVLGSAKAIQAFYESRFFTAKYVFLLRNPIDTLLSTAKLMRIENDALLIRECDAWLSYIQLWADWIRIFPNTLTIVADGLHSAHVDRLASFTCSSLEHAELLLNPSNRRHHEIPDHFPTFAHLRDDLMEVFALAQAAVEQPASLRQAEQKRSAMANDSRGQLPGEVAVMPLPLGQAWIKALSLRKSISKTLGNADEQQIT